MVKIKFIGYSRDSMTTKRGEVLDGYKLFYLDKLRKGNGYFGTSKFVTDDRLRDLEFSAGLPDLDTEYEVEFDSWGNFASCVPV